MIRKQYINNRLRKLIRHHDTNDPFQIAQEHGIIITFENLGKSIYGYYNKVCRVKFIHINSNLNEHNQLFTCRHELCHALEHANENTPALSKVSLCSEIIIEAEANYFATQMTIDGSHEEYGFISKYDILKFYGLPSEMVCFI